MTSEKTNPAYDLNLFDEDGSAYTHGTAAPKRNPKQTDRQQPKKVRRNKNNVVQLTEDELHNSRKRKHNPLKLALTSVGVIMVSLIIGAILVGQVQITELNQSIISAEEKLETAQSVYTQNQMKVEANLSTEQIDEYATDVLGMTKASNAQKEFVSLSSGDNAEVSAQKDENIFTQFIESITNLWS